VTYAGSRNLIGVALLVASLVGFLVFVFLEVVFLVVIPVMRMIVSAFAHALLVGFVFRIIRALVLGLYGACTDAQANCYRQSPDTVSQFVFHRSDTARAGPFGISAPMVAFAKVQARAANHIWSSDRLWSGKLNACTSNLRVFFP